MGIGDRGWFSGLETLSQLVSEFRRRKSPQNVGLSATMAEVSKFGECLAVEAVCGEPVSAVKFLANRENNREFQKKLSFWQNWSGRRSVESVTYTNPR